MPSARSVASRLGRGGRRLGSAPEAMIRGYLDCALWSSTDESDESGGEPMDNNYTTSDIDDQTKRQMRADVSKFFIKNRALIDAGGQTDEQVGHDFWLSRNGHGAGFFDRDLGDVGDRLQAAAKKFGGFNLYVDNGTIYGSRG